MLDEQTPIPQIDNAQLGMQKSGKDILTKLEFDSPNHRALKVEVEVGRVFA